MTAAPAYTFAEPFPLVRYRLDGVVIRRIAFRDFAGSALRGAFGHALKDAVCVTHLAQCASCPLYRTCAYPMLFEPPRAPGGHHQAAPVPWVIEPPAPGALVREAGEPFAFELVLVGQALNHTGLVFEAWRAALAKSLGRNGAVQLLRISTESGIRVVDASMPRMQPHDHAMTIPPAPADCRRATLHFVSPLQFTRNGKATPPALLTARDILMGLVRRVADLVESQLQRELAVDFAALARHTDTVTMTVDWHPQQWQRYSSRQHRSMPMGGVIGRCQLHGNLTPFWPFLYLGQWLHVGKKSSFGMGRYTLQPPATPDN